MVVVTVDAAEVKGTASPVVVSRNKEGRADEFLNIAVLGDDKYLLEKGEMERMRVGDALNLNSGDLKNSVFFVVWLVENLNKITFI